MTSVGSRCIFLPGVLNNGLQILPGDPAYLFNGGGGSGYDADDNGGDTTTFGDDADSGEDFFDAGYEKTFSELAKLF